MRLHHHRIISLSSLLRGNAPLSTSSISGVSHDGLTVSARFSLLELVFAIEKKKVLFNKVLTRVKSVS